MLGSLRGGLAYDRFPGHRLLPLFILGIAGMMALAPLPDKLWLLTAVLFLLGLAEGAVDVGGNTLLVWVHQRHVGPYMNALHFFFGVGALLTPIIAAQIYLRTNDISWVYWLLAIYLVPVAIWVARLPSPKAPHAIHASQYASLDVSLVALIILFFIFYVGAEMGFAGWIFTYATASNLANPAAAAYLTSLFWGAFTVGRLLGIPLATRFSPRLLLLLDWVGCLFSISLILLYPDSLLFLAIGSAGLGISMASMFPSMLVYAGQRMPLSGQVTSWFFVGSGAGGMLMPWLFGLLFAAVGPTAVMWAILFDLVLVGGVYGALWLYNRRSMSQAPV
jgi:MFS transporter, FHS family, Na+ dependent glucose transporter 1